MRRGEEAKRAGAADAAAGSAAGRRFGAAAPPKDATGLAVAALAAAALVMAASWAMLLDLHAALITLESGGAAVDAVLVLLGLAAGLPLASALRGLRLAGRAKGALSDADLVAARVAAAGARNLAWTSFGYVGAQALLVVLVEFLIANNLAVSRTFFFLPLIESSL